MSTEVTSTATGQIDDTADPDHTRRRVVGAFAGAGAALVAGAVAGGGTAAAITRETSRSLSVEVACLGPTVRITLAPVLAEAMPALYGDATLDPSDLSGSPFSAEGLIYPAGTIKGDDFIPTDNGAIGLWICRGFFINGPRRPEPHMSTDQTFHFGRATFDSGVGQSMVATHGLEGADRPTWEVMRMITGGSGEYRGARGQCRQAQTGTNATLFPWGAPAVNYDFDFDFVE